MQTTTTNPKGQNITDTEKIKSLKEEWQNFKEQEKLNDRVLKTQFPVMEIPVDIWQFFMDTRDLSTPERMASVDKYLKLQRCTSFEGFTFDEIGAVFNFIESTSYEETRHLTGITRDQHIDIIEKTYNQLAQGVWMKTVESWKEEIVEEKQALLQNLNDFIADVNRRTEEANKNKSKTRKERKALNTSTGLSATKGNK